VRRLLVLGLLLALVACAQQQPPPAATAPPPQVAVAPPPPPMPPPPPPPRTSFDGLYKGSFVPQPFGGGTQELVGGNCDPELPINMRVKRGSVRIWYKNFNGRTLHYRGTINATGTVETSHTNRGGGGAILALQISNNQATGNLQRGRCWYGVTMTKT
jgi:hypothetical protein